MRITVDKFEGISPKTPPRSLQNNQAQIAINCTPGHSLRPLFDTIEESTGVATTHNSLYRWGQSTSTPKWFAWTETNIKPVIGPNSQDSSERTYFTLRKSSEPNLFETDVEKATLTTLGTPAHFTVGVPPPKNALKCTATGVVDDTAIKETRVYTYTFVNDKNEESTPVEASKPITIQGQNVTLTFAAGDHGTARTTTTTTNGYRADKERRIYRSVNGTFLLVKVLALADSTWTDNVSAEDLEIDELPDPPWDMPPNKLRGLVSLPNGILAGFDGRDVYFSEPYRPFAWPMAYSQTLNHDIVGLAVLDTTLVVLTNGFPYFIQGAHPNSMVVIKTSIEQACVAERSIVSINGGVYYASPDGLVMLSPGGSKIITDALFTKSQWEELRPKLMHAYQYDSKYIAFNPQISGFIYDTLTQQFYRHDKTTVKAAYNDLLTDALYLLVGTKLMRWDAGSPLQYTWKSKLFSSPYETTFSCGQVEAEDYQLGTTTVTETFTVTPASGTPTAATHTKTTTYRLNGVLQSTTIVATQAVMSGSTLTLTTTTTYPTGNVNVVTEVESTNASLTRTSDGVQVQYTATIEDGSQLVHTEIWRNKSPVPTVRSNLEFKLFIDGALRYTQQVKDRKPFRIPFLRGKDFEMQVTGTQEVFKMSIAQSMSELADV
jgi:hypothetical protein